MLTFVWTKSQSGTPSNIDWELKIIGMDDDLAEAIQTQVNSVSSLAENPGATQGEIDEELVLRDRDAYLEAQAEAIQTQVNSVSSLAENPGATQGEIDEELVLRDRDAHLEAQAAAE